MSDVLFGDNYYWAMKLDVPDLVNFRRVLDLNNLISFAHKTMKKRKRTKLPKKMHTKEDMVKLEQK